MVELVNHEGKAVGRHPNIIRKELRAVRRSLDGANKKANEALTELEASKRARVMKSILVDKERAYIEAGLVVDQHEDHLKTLEAELLGSWAPEAKGGLSNG